MKTITEFLDISILNSKLITESFKSSIIRDIRQQFNDRIKKNHEKNALNKYSNDDTSSTFKKVFGNETIDWDNITDEEFKKFKKSDEEGIKLTKRIMSNRSNSFNGMIIFLNNDSNSDIKYTGCFISNGWGGRYFSFISNWTISSKDVRPSEAVDYLPDEFYILDLTNHSTRDKQNERSKSKSGVINLFNNEKDRKSEYAAIAKQNKERYVQYAAKMKANKEANDGMAEKVMEYVNKIMEVTAKMSKDPLKYAKYEYDIGYLIDLLQDERRYVSGRTSSQSYYSGTNGLLVVYKEYIKTKLSQAKGSSYDFERKEYEAAKKKLEEIFNTIDAKLEKFEEKIAA